MFVSQELGCRNVRRGQDGPNLVKRQWEGSGGEKQQKGRMSEISPSAVHFFLVYCIKYEYLLETPAQIQIEMIFSKLSLSSDDGSTN